MTNIKRIVLTGGPCAGKTTALVRIIEHFTSLGYKVFTIPEVPTMFTQAGMDYLTANHEFFYEGEKATLQTQMALEDHFYEMAKTLHGPVIIVCDRGTMDISAYMEPAMWEEITRACGTSTSQLRDTRYDAVLHLVSAADGAEQFYTTNNNAQRLEKADEHGLAIARQLDKKVIQAWSGHPHLRVINNHEDFNNKLNRVLKEISSVLGLAQPVEQERKYIVAIYPEPSRVTSCKPILWLSPTARLGCASVDGRARMCMCIPPRSLRLTMNSWKRNAKSTKTSTTRCCNRPILTAAPYTKCARVSFGKGSILSWTSFLSPYKTSSFSKQKG